MPDDAELAAHEEYLRQIAAQQFLSPDERIAHQAYMASRSWAEAERQRIRAHPRKSKVITRAQARACGLCSLCKYRDARPGYAYCESCAAKNRERAAQRKAVHLGNGKCVKCFKREPLPGYQKCAQCMEMHRNQVAQGRPRKVWIVPVGAPLPTEQDAGIVADRRSDARNAADAHRAAVNALVGLANGRPDDRELRRVAKALVASGNLLMEAL